MKKRRDRMWQEVLAHMTAVTFAAKDADASEVLASLSHLIDSLVELKAEEERREAS